jgi:hypothetical protein
VLQLVKSGTSSSAFRLGERATLSPQAGVMSMHFLFRRRRISIKAMADPGVAVRSRR